MAPARLPSSARRMRSQQAAAPGRSVSGISTANSSPPARQATSVGRVSSSSTRPTSRRTPSAAACPWRAISARKSSTSRTATARSCYGGVARRGGRLVALDGGVIETPSGLALERRLAAIHAGVAELIDEHRPDAVAVEELYFGANVRTAFSVGHARGAALLA